ncbi:MAG: hypothetical protein WBG43_12970 [Marinifilaceae bacterium]
MIIKYMFNGDILSLSRNAFDVKAKKTVNMDDLLYGYSGNQLKRVEDAGSSSGFKNGASVDAEYLYDTNGNMTRDLNKGIKDIKYNESGKSNPHKHPYYRDGRRKKGK